MLLLFFLLRTSLAYVLFHSSRNCVRSRPVHDTNVAGFRNEVLILARIHVRLHMLTIIRSESGEFNDKALVVRRKKEIPWDGTMKISHLHLDV